MDYPVLLYSSYIAPMNYRVILNGLEVVFYIHKRNQEVSKIVLDAIENFYGKLQLDSDKVSSWAYKCLRHVKEIMSLELDFSDMLAIIASSTVHSYLHTVSTNPANNVKVVVGTGYAKTFEEELTIHKPSYLYFNVKDSTTYIMDRTAGESLYEVVDWMQSYLKALNRLGFSKREQEISCARIIATVLPLAKKCLDTAETPKFFSEESHFGSILSAVEVDAMPPSKSPYPGGFCNDCGQPYWSAQGVRMVTLNYCHCEDKKERCDGCSKKHLKKDMSLLTDTLNLCKKCNSDIVPSNRRMSSFNA